MLPCERLERGRITIAIEIKVLSDGNNRASGQEARKASAGDLNPKGNRETLSLEPISQNGLLHSDNAASPDSIDDPADDHDGKGGHVGGGGNNDVSNQDKGAGQDAASPSPKGVNENPPKEWGYGVHQRHRRLQQPVLGVGDPQLLNEFTFEGAQHLGRVMAPNHHETGAHQRQDLELPRLVLVDRGGFHQLSFP